MFATASPPGNGGVINKPARIVDNLGQSLVGDVELGMITSLDQPVLPGMQHCYFLLLLHLHCHFAPSNKLADRSRDQLQIQ